ncbi:MAG: hypothetical protein VX938_03985, partial [Myxococcota bacterium]|nr:hypothetical protein [Myxococcota bacterium]
AFMTDHPSFLRDQPFEELLYAAESLGDQVIYDETGQGWAVVFQCPEGQGGPDGRSRLRVGFEGTHTMPLGIRRHLSDPQLYSVSFKTETPSEDLQALTTEVRAAGGLVAIAHSEQEDLDWETIAAHDVSAMELYNFHANFNVALDDIFEALKVLDPFVSQAPGAPHSDLSALSVLALYPTPALEKWRKVTAIRHITAFAGSDVHENVILPGLCVDGLCESLADDIPNLVGALETEGPLFLSDGDRIDSYGRIFRWVQNRLWIDPDADIFADTQNAMESGRNQVVFEVLGDAPGVELVAAIGEGDDAVISDTGATFFADDGAVLWARTPDVPTPGRVASWTDGSAAEITGTVFRTDTQGTEAVLTWTGPSTWRSLPLDTPGAYQLEVTIVPHHLVDALGPSSDLAEQSYRWVETNAIRVVSEATEASR